MSKKRKQDGTTQELVVLAKIVPDEERDEVIGKIIDLANDMLSNRRPHHAETITYLAADLWLTHQLQSKTQVEKVQ